jgi:hypothetical protein
MYGLSFGLATELQKILNVLGWLQLTLSGSTLNILMSISCVYWANPKYTRFLFIPMLYVLQKLEFFTLFKQYKFKRQQSLSWSK